MKYAILNEVLKESKSVPEERGGAGVAGVRELSGMQDKSLGRGCVRET